MATANSTRSTHSTRAPKDESQFVQMALDLNRFGILLAGVSEICKADNIGGDALEVAAVTCDQINEAICRMADRLDAMAMEGGAA